MKNLIFILLVTFITTTLFVYCERIQPLPSASELKMEKISVEAGIPLEYGKLISITSPLSGRAHLWFEDENHSIRLVEILYGKGKSGYILERVWKIERY